jgi:hypothetical protein
MVRLSDSITAALVDHGVYWQGLAMQWREDSLFGVVAEVAVPMVRMSARGVQVLQLRGQP